MFGTINHFSTNMLYAFLRTLVQKCYGVEPRVYTDFFWARWNSTDVWCVIKR